MGDNQSYSNLFDKLPQNISQRIEEPKDSDLFDSVIGISSCIASSFPIDLLRPFNPFTIALATSELLFSITLPYFHMLKPFMYFISQSSLNNNTPFFP